MRAGSFIVAASVSASTVFAAAPEPVSSAAYALIQRYTAYASASYALECPTPPYGSQEIAQVNGSTTDSRASLFYDSTLNEVVLSFRGSSFPQNLDTDFQFALANLSIPGLSCASCNVHQGFQTVWTALQSNVTSAVQSALAANSGSSLVVTGHSLGAALASLAATSFAAAGTDLTVFTFGEPRNGDADWSNYVDSLISPSSYYRVTHTNDGVPQIPPTSYGYVHHGTEYWEDGTTQAATSNCGTGEVTDCNASQDYGANPINGAHILYPGVFLAGVSWNPACGYPQVTFA